MTRNEKLNLRRRAAWRRLGFLSKLPLKLALMACFIMGALYVQSKQEAAKAFADSLTIPAPLPEFVCNHLLESYLVAGSIALIVLRTYPFHRKMVSDGCLRIALTNAAGETPTLLREYKDRKNPYVRVWELSNPGIPLKVWEDKRLDIEAAFDSNIISIAYGKSTNRIVLKFVSGRNAIPNHMECRGKISFPRQLCACFR